MSTSSENSLLTDDMINQACEILAGGGVVAMPTETVYGLAARIDSEAGIKKIFSVKQRPFFDPLIVHVSSIEQAKSCALDWNELNQKLAELFWPGPLTMVIPKNKKISDLITSGLTTVGLRWPKHSVACRLIEAAGVPLAAPSANRFGKTSPTQASHVADEFGDAVMVLNGSASEIGIESTVLSVKKIGEKFELAILRKGALLQSQITEKLTPFHFNFQWVEITDKKESPGHMKHHYMPSVPLVICKNPQMKFEEMARLLNEKIKELPDEVEGVQIVKPKGAIKRIEILRLSNKPEQAARELYSQLRSVSQRSPDALCFIQSSAQTGEMWESIFDRLYKAASLILD
ncbi:MAG: L-threonylcarbamoyladenylate synthase [Pseudobdellovibrio sp.]